MPVLQFAKERMWKADGPPQYNLIISPLLPKSGSNSVHKNQDHIPHTLVIFLHGVFKIPEIAIIKL